MCFRGVTMVKNRKPLIKTFIRSDTPKNVCLFIRLDFQALHLFVQAAVGHVQFPGSL